LVDYDNMEWVDENLGVFCSVLYWYRGFDD